MSNRTAVVLDGDASEPGIAQALTQAAHAALDHTGIPGVGGGAGTQTLEDTLALGNTTGTTDPISLDAGGDRIVGGGNIAITGAVAADRANIGSTTLAVAQGDFAAGLAGSNRIFYDASNNRMTQEAATPAAANATANALQSWAGETNYAARLTAAGIPPVVPTFATQYSRGTLAAPATVVNADEVGRYEGRGYIGPISGYAEFGGVRVEVDGAPGDNTQSPGAVSIWTTPTAALAALERWRVGADGHLVPATDNAYDLGSNSFRVRDIFAVGGVTTIGSASFASLNVGTVTDAVATGDVAAGVAGGNRFFYDQSNPLEQFLITGAFNGGFYNVIENTEAAGASANAGWRVRNDVGDTGQIRIFGGTHPFSGDTQVIANSGNLRLSSGTGFNTTLEVANTAYWFLNGDTSGLNTVGHICAQLDDSYDIGSRDGGTTPLRPRNIYASQTFRLGSNIALPTIFMDGAAGNVTFDGYARIGSATAAVAAGDFAAGDGTREMSYDSSDSRLTISASGNDRCTVFSQTGSGTAAFSDFVAQADVGGSVVSANFTATSAAYTTTSTYDLPAAALINASLNATNGLVLNTFGTAPIRFFTNTGFSGAERWQITSTGHFLAATDNAYDIGASGASRPRSVYVGTALNVGSTTAAVAAGDFAAGLAGGNRLFYDQSAGIFRVIDASTTPNSQVLMGQGSLGSKLIAIKGVAATTGTTSVATWSANSSTAAAAGFAGVHAYEIDSLNACQLLWGTDSAGTTKDSFFGFNVSRNDGTGLFTIMQLGNIGGAGTNRRFELFGHDGVLNSETLRCYIDPVAGQFALGSTPQVFLDGEVGYGRIGTATDAAAQGDFVAGLSGAARIFFDASGDIFTHYGSFNGVVQTQIRNETDGTTARARLLLSAGGVSPTTQGALEVRAAGHSGLADAVVLSSFSNASNGIQISTNVAAAPITLISNGNEVIRVVDNTLGFFTTGPVAQQADIGALTDSTGGAVDGTLAAVSGSGDDATINDNFADLANRLSALRTLLQAYGLMA